MDVHSSRILPSSMRQMVMPFTSILAPVAGTQPDRAVFVPRKTHSTETQIAFGNHGAVSDFQVRTGLLLKAHGSLILSQIPVAVQSVIEKIPGVNLIGNLKLALVEDFVEHAPRDGLVLFLLRNRSRWRRCRRGKCCGPRRHNGQEQKSHGSFHRHSPLSTQVPGELQSSPRVRWAPNLEPRNQCTPSRLQNAAVVCRKLYELSVLM